MKNPFRFFRAALIVVMGSLILAAAASPRGTDARIRNRVADLIAKHEEYSHVQFQVDDAVVTLKGTVQLESQRRSAVREVKALPGVAAVHTNISLNPPALPDDVLYPRVLHRLAGLHLAQLQVSVPGR